MIFLKKSIVIKKRRAVSQVIGALLALAIVATFGTVLLIQGVQGVQNFTSFLDIFQNTGAKSAQEVFVVEHVRFTPTTDAIEIWVRNTGKIDITVDKVSIVKINSQELIVSKEGINKNVFQKNATRIQFYSSANVTMPTKNCSCSSSWQQVFNTEGSGSYRITVSTIRDKSIETIAGLFNS